MPENSWRNFWRGARPVAGPYWRAVARLRPLSFGEGCFGIVIFSVDSEEDPKRRQNQFVEGVREEVGEGERGKEEERRASEERVVKGK